ncbi:MAG: hypothetical protein ABI597_05525 [Gammaproteobacteria bacterium]
MRSGNASSLITKGKEHLIAAKKAEENADKNLQAVHYQNAVMTFTLAMNMNPAGDEVYEILFLIGKSDLKYAQILLDIGAPSFQAKILLQQAHEFLNNAASQLNQSAHTSAKDDIKHKIINKLLVECKKEMVKLQKSSLESLQEIRICLSEIPKIYSNILSLQVNISVLKSKSTPSDSLQIERQSLLEKNLVLLAKNLTIFTTNMSEINNSDVAVSSLEVLKDKFELLPPVRILRAINFATRFEIPLDDAMKKAIRLNLAELDAAARANPGRMNHWMLKLFRSECVLDNFDLLSELGILSTLFPSCAPYLQSDWVAEELIKNAESRYTSLNRIYAVFITNAFNAGINDPMRNSPLLHVNFLDPRAEQAYHLTKAIDRLVKHKARNAEVIQNCHGEIPVQDTYQMYPMSAMGAEQYLSQGGPSFFNSNTSGVLTKKSVIQSTSDVERKPTKQ